MRKRLILSTLTCALATGAARGAPILNHAPAPGVAAFDRFIAGGPGLWSRVPMPPETDAVRNEIHYAATHPNTANPELLEYLEWRRDINPARFDHYHPRIGPVLATLTPPAPPSAPPISLPPSGPGPGTNPPPTPPAPPPIAVIPPPPPPTPTPPPVIETPPGGVVITMPTAPPYTPPPSSVPEPQTVVGGIVGLIILLWQQRRAYG